MNIPDFEIEKLFSDYRKKDFMSVAKTFVEIIKHFNVTCYTSFSREEKCRFDDCMFAFFYILTQPDFQIPSEYANVFVNVSHLIVNMAMASSLGSTYPLLQRVLSQDSNYTKLLTLATCHTPLNIETDALFQPNPALASIWWLNYQTAAAGTLTPEVHERVVNHLKNVPKLFTLPDLRTAPLYFQCTYFSPDTDRIIKQEINRQLRIKLSGAKIHNNPRKNSIAIISDRWQSTTAVYKSCYHQIERLANKYDLTLVYFSEDKENKIDTHLFKDIKRVFVQPDMKRIDFSAIKHNDFQLAYFPDIGMNYESVCLSNMQVAPIMATGYGHPVSTFGSKIDYFIGGQETELPELADTNYSERLILIPGLGAHPVFPNYVRKNPLPSEFIINCCWTTPKINYPMLEALKEIKKRATRPIIFHFFPSWTVSRYQGAMAFLQGMDKVFDGGVRVYLDTPYQQYLEILEKGQFTLDSYPFGGYNTVVDSMFVGCPVVTLEGTRFFNRASSALMRRVKLNELVSHTKQDYVEKALSLIDNPLLLQCMRDKVINTDLKSLLIDNDEPTYFANAIDYILNFHEAEKQSKNREPIILV